MVAASVSRCRLLRTAAARARETGAGSPPCPGAARAARRPRPCRESRSSRDTEQAVQHVVLEACTAVCAARDSRARAPPDGRAIMATESAISIVAYWRSSVRRAAAVRLRRQSSSAAATGARSTGSRAVGVPAVQRLNPGRPYSQRSGRGCDGDRGNAVASMLPRPRDIRRMVSVLCAELLVVLPACARAIRIVWTGSLGQSRRAAPARAWQSSATRIECQAGFDGTWLSSYRQNDGRRRRTRAIPGHS